MVLYKEFKVGDLMNMKSGKRVTKKKQIKGDIPYVTAVSTNNGIDNYIGNPPFVVNNVITMSFLGDGFYHPYDVSFKDGTYGFKLKEEGKESREVYLYLLTQIRKQGSQLGDYSNGLRGNQIVEFNIELPVKTLEDTEPDWEYMEEYIKQKELAYIGKLNKEFEHKKEQLIELIGEESEYINIEELPTAKFKVGDLFKISRGLKTLKPQDREKGDIPYINSSEENNGIADYIGNPTIVRNDTISIGLFGKAFYQEGNFTMANNTYSLENENVNKYTGLYICSAIERVREGHEFGYTNPITKKALIPLEIELPVNPELTELVPDWNAMEKYIARIELQLLNRITNTLNT